MDETLLEGRGGCAEVRAYGRRFRYRRSGTGAPVLLLRAPDGSGIDTDLAACLAARFALIEPRMSDLEADAAPWLACFLEGLGTAEIVILADECFGDEAVALARISPHQIERIAVIRNGPLASDPAPVDGPYGVGGSSATAPPEAPVPLLVVDLDLPHPVRPAKRLADFLGGSAGASRPA